jgi:hypothetical protein
MAALGGESRPLEMPRGERRACVLCRLGLLRWVTLLSFNLAYVVVPLLLFERTHSILLVGLAMIGEGLLRAVLALGVGASFRSLGASVGMLIACALRLFALALLALAVVRFSVVIVALASTLFYIGHFFATLEQELRAATLGRRAVAAQTAHRLAEVLAPPVAFGLALAGNSLGREYAVMLGAAAISVVAHGAGFFAWFGNEPRSTRPPPTLRVLMQGWQYLRGRPSIVRGLLASIIGFAFFGWAVLATPFALQGRVLVGFPLDSAAGIALFKTLAALFGVAGALLSGRWLGDRSGVRVIVLSTIAAPLVFALGLTIRQDWIAVALLSVVCAMLLGLFTWQRRLRQLASAPEHFQSVTAWCMALECLHISLVGVALIVQAPWALAVGGSAVLLLLLQPWKRPAARQVSRSP